MLGRLSDGLLEVEKLIESAERHKQCDQQDAGGKSNEYIEHGHSRGPNLQRLLQLNRKGASKTERGALCSHQPVPGLQVLGETEGSDRRSYSRTETAKSALFHLPFHVQQKVQRTGLQ